MCEPQWHSRLTTGYGSTKNGEWATDPAPSALGRLHWGARVRLTFGAGVVNPFLLSSYAGYNIFVTRDQKLLLPIGLLGIAVALLYTVGQLYFLFWKFTLYDKLLHFLGGIWITFSCFWIVRSRYSLKLSGGGIGSILPFCLLISVIMGVGWELYEYAVGLAWNPLSSHLADTLTDMAMDIAGGLAAALWITRSLS